MSYLVLARKWRPKTFDDVVGQEYITLALKNAIATRKLAHALIFSGPRGVGKTSVARIVAKALNCDKSDDNNTICIEDPCTFCSEISEGTSIDVQEIDAASHTGVNDVREIIENVKYLPSSAKSKVYIIDEAHMLSQAAFNALLKTLEEPPGHVLFILATTEAHKIPATIQSRCQRYDFRKLTVNEIRSLLQEISESESIEIDQETLITLSKEADGSIRDALSILDQLIATFGTTINYEDSLSSLGLLDRTQLFEILGKIINKDPRAAFDALNQIMARGVTHKKIADEIVTVIRNSLLIKICGEDADLELSKDDIIELKQITSGSTVEDLEILFNIALESGEKVHKSSFTELSLEAMVIRLATLETTVPINQIIEKIESLTEGAAKPGTREEVGDTAAVPVKTPSQPSSEKKPDDTVSEGAESSFVTYVKSQNTILGLHLEKAASIVDEDSVLKINYNSRSLNYEYLKKKNSKDSIQNYADKYFKSDLKVRVELEDKGENKEDTEKFEMEKNDAVQDTMINDALNIFDGKILKKKGI